MFDSISGRVLFPDGSSLGSRSMVPSVRTASVYGGGPTTATHRTEASITDEFARVFENVPLRSISTVESYAAITTNGGAQEEHYLWQLVGDMLRDCERSPQYLPARIGNAQVAPQRRWFISQHAHIQELLLTNTLLRRANITLRWLERKYRLTSGVSSRGLRVRQVDTEHDAVLLRRIVLGHLRGGELQPAMQAAESAKDALYSCVLAASEMQTEYEPWYQHTALIPLFGEYGNGEVPSGEELGANNAHRLTNISYLYEDTLAVSQQRDETSTTKSLDQLIAATLSGNTAALQNAFEEDATQPQWQHQLWALLRGALVASFSKLLVMSGAEMPSMKYLQYLDGYGRGPAGTVWDVNLSEGLLRDVMALLQPLLRAGTTLSLEEQLQIRVILQFFASASVSADHSGVFLLKDLSASNASQATTNTLFGHSPNPNRLIAHLLLCLDLAHSEQLVRLPLQGMILVDALSGFVALLERESWLQWMPSICAMTLRLTSPKFRAIIFGAFIFALRRGTLDRGATKQSTEEQEAALVHHIQAQDHNAIMHDAIVAVLNDTAAQAANAKHLLKNNAQCEALMFDAMRCDSAASAMTVLQRALNLALVMWQHDELDALATVVDVTRRFVLPKVTTAMQSSHTDQLHYWDAVLNVHRASVSHMKTLASLKQRAEPASAYERLEVPQRSTLLQEVHNVLSHSRGIAAAQGAASSVIAGCTAWAVRTAAESVTLVFTLSPIQEVAGQALLATLFALVERFDHTTGLMERGVLPRQHAESLFSAIRTARAAFGARRFQLRAVNDREAAAPPITQHA